MAHLTVGAIAADPQAGLQRQSVASTQSVRAYPAPAMAPPSPPPPPRGPDQSAIVAPCPQDQPIGPPPAFAVNILEALVRERLHPRPAAIATQAAAHVSARWPARAPPSAGRTVDRQF